MAFGLPNRKEFYSKCLTPTELAFRLYTHFQWRGYVNPNLPYVTPDKSELKWYHSKPWHECVKQNLHRQLYQGQIVDRQTARQVKEKFMVDLFKTLSEDLFKQVLMKYQLDIDLFSFEHQRDKLLRSLSTRSNN